MDTMFPDISPDRYVVTFLKMPHAWWLKVRAYEDFDQNGVQDGYSFQIDYVDLKQDDLLHLVEEALHRIAECTP